MQDFASMLDQMMGRDRNRLPTEAASKLDLTDRKYCPYYLADYCPHDLFTNTKMDLGPCPKIHDIYAKRQYDELSQSEKDAIGARDKLYNFCEELVSNLERKIYTKRQREEVRGTTSLSLSASTDPDTVLSHQRQFESHDKQLKDVVEQMVETAEHDDIDGVQQLMNTWDKLQRERKELKKICNPAFATMAKRMHVCDTCGSFLVETDSEKRRQAHLEGKQHMGFYQLRKFIQDNPRPSRHSTGSSAVSTRSRSRSRDDRRSSGRHRSSRSHRGRSSRSDRGKRRRYDD